MGPEDDLDVGLRRFVSLSRNEEAGVVPRDEEALLILVRVHRRRSNDLPWSGRLQGSLQIVR